MSGRPAALQTIRGRKATVPYRRVVVLADARHSEQSVPMFKLGDITFGDNVRIIQSDATADSGHADMLGTCYGFTTPSVTGVEVIGNAPEDTALNVHFDDEGIEDAWFSPELVLFVDHAGGSTATVGDHAFVKDADGSWSSTSPPTSGKVQRRKWFRRS